MKEAALRDLIAQQINKLKPGLGVLLQKEQYIPSEHGTKSFIDLYAKDSEIHVIIASTEWAGFPLNVFTPMPVFPSREFK